MQNVNNIPAGYLKNAKGHLVPQELVKPIDALRDELVRDLCAEANNISEQLASFKRRALARIDEFVEFSAAEYDVKIGGKKGNIDLVSYDGELKIVVQVRDLLQLDERMLAARITAQLSIPTIGIGASPACDGQILVMEDMLGLSPRVPKFVKEFGKVGAAIEGAIRMYAEDVRSRAFPAPENTYEMKD